MTPQENKESRLHVSEEIPLASVYNGEERRHFLEPFILLAKRKLFISYFVLGSIAVSAAVAFLLPTYYKSNVKLLPPQQTQSIATAMLGQLGPLIAAAGGKDLGLRNSNDVYISMLHSRTLADVLIDKHSLMAHYHVKLRQKARDRLDDLTDITVGKDGVISISVEDRDRALAKDLADDYWKELQKLSKSLAVTDASRRRKFFEDEVKITSDQLADAEIVLKKTMESTGIIHLEDQSRSMLDAYEKLRAEVTAQEVQIQAMRSFATPENPDLIRAEQELVALRGQLQKFEHGQGGTPSIANVPLQNVPSAGLEYIRKLRDVKYRETLYELLAKQLEIARIDEAKDSSIIQPLDTPELPERHSWPMRGLLIAIGTVLGLLIAVIWVYVSESIARAKEDPLYLAGLQMLKMYLFKGSKSMKDFIT
ncbi:MAG: hypothetical protein DMG65_23680 [Candidatus Angelobacter sp. Gp1-AA117]|nr:MAG: hypothetical protein DMG65_23680 [Candidatus Angelobacter sp. Gp1-AA117]